MKNLVYLLTVAAVSADSADDILQEYEALSRRVVNNLTLEDS
jgi:hypothetical protein